MLVLGRDQKRIEAWFVTHRKLGYALFLLLATVLILMDASGDLRGSVATVAAPPMFVAAVAGLLAEGICPGSTAVVDRPSARSRIAVVGALLLSLTLQVFNAPTTVLFAVGSVAIAASGFWAYDRRTGHGTRQQSGGPNN